MNMLDMIGGARRVCADFSLRRRSHSFGRLRNVIVFHGGLRFVRVANRGWVTYLSLVTIDAFWTLRDNHSLQSRHCDRAAILHTILWSSLDGHLASS